jgi:hypothetical protein
MARVPREHERTATAPAAENAGNLCAVLHLFAAWRTCEGCGLRVLFVNEQARSDGPFICGLCERRREALGRKCRAPAPEGLASLPVRVALHLRALFATGNDNGVASMGGG